MTHLFDVFESKSQTPLVPHIVLLGAFVLDVVAIRLVNRIISQMHVQVVQVVLIRRPVLACR